MRIKDLVGLGFLLMALSPATHASSPISVTKLDRLVVHDFGGQILLSLPANMSNSEGCQDNRTLVIQKSHPSFKEMYAAALSSFQANSNISGWVHGCDATFNAPILVRLDLVR